MAAVADVTLVNISINDVDIQVPKGELVVEAVKRLGLEVPIFCYHPRMKPVGMCRMCLVEVGFKQPDGSVRKMPKPQTACTLPCTEGLVIYTDTQAVHNDRKGVLEFLLINHPLDCPICDRGGECPLQNNTLYYGPTTSRYVELKRHAPKAYRLSQYVTLDLERCIQCGRCVRFTEEISGDGQLALRFRGARTQPGTFELRDFNSKFSGNVIEICPVGALTSSKYRFRARPWDLQTRAGVCTLCSNGCNVHVDYRTNQVVRINSRTNEAVNEEWTCDRGKFGHDVFNSDNRLTTVLVRKGDALVASDWSTAFSTILTGFKDATAAGLAGGTLTNEDYFLFATLLRKGFGSDHLDYRFEKSLASGVTGVVNNTIASLESARQIFAFGTSLADEEPIVYLRVRKAWAKNGSKIVVAHHEATDLDSFAHTILRYRAGTEAALAEGLLNLVKGGGDLAALASVTGVPAGDLTEAVELLKAGAATITTRGLLNVPQGPATVASLQSLAEATAGTYNLYARRANEEGADLIGVRPLSGGKDTYAILRGCVDGSVQALWLAGVDPFAECADTALVQRALETVPFLVVQDHSENGAFPYASVVLPMAAPTETQGSYTNVERRVQTFGQVLPARGESKAAWRTFNELLIRIRPQTPYFNAPEILDAIAATVPAYAGASYAAANGEGFLLS